MENLHLFQTVNCSFTGFDHKTTHLLLHLSQQKLEMFYRYFPIFERKSVSSRTENLWIFFNSNFLKLEWIFGQFAEKNILYVNCKKVHHVQFCPFLQLMCKIFKNLYLYDHSFYKLNPLKNVILLILAIIYIFSDFLKHPSCFFSNHNTFFPHSAGLSL